MAKLEIRLVDDNDGKYPCGEVYEMTEDEVEEVYLLVRDYCNTHSTITVHPNNLIGGPVLHPANPG